MANWINKSVFDVMKTRQYAHEMGKALQVMDKLARNFRSHPYKDLQAKSLNNVLGMIDEYRLITKKQSKLDARERGFVVTLCERVLHTVIKNELEKQPDLKAEYERRKTENEKQLEKILQETNK